MPPRVPQDQIDRLNVETSLVRVIEAAGVELAQVGPDHEGRCPFCDGEASLVVSAAANTWSCTACGTGGTEAGVVDWVIRAEGVNLRHAVELLEAGYEPMPIGRGGPPRVSTVRRLASPVEPDAADQAQLRQVLDYYHETLKREPRALAYLERRGLTDSSLIERFGLGFANRTLGLRLPAKNRKAGREIRARLQRLGILREASGHEHFNGALVVPITDEDGTIRQVYGRKITPGLRKGSALHPSAA
jgi:DNA primase